MKRIQQKPDHLRRAPAQALVEFALAATLIFFLLAAAIDLGLIFFTMQGLRTAAQEGATYGSYPVAVYTSGGTEIYGPTDPSGLTFNRIDLNYAEIVNRVYGSGGTGPVSGFANLRDLDGNGQDDIAQNLHPATPSGASASGAWIRIESLYNVGGPPAAGASPRTCRGNVRGGEMQDGGRNCYIRVTVSYNYRFLFPLAPAFGNNVRLSASHLMPVRSSFFTN